MKTFYIYYKQTYAKIHGRKNFDAKTIEKGAAEDQRDAKISC
jgi:hypothetical protein